jgi:PAS domain S-box-containing protein
VGTDALRPTEHELASLSAEAGDLLLLVAPDGDVAWSSGAAALGYAEDELRGAPVATLFPADRAEEGRRHVAGGDTRDGGTIETEMVTASGQRRPVALTRAPLRRDGSVVGVLVHARDLSAQREAEDALRLSQARLQEAQRVGHIGSWEWDMAADAIRWSEEMYHLSGVDPSGSPLGVDEYMAAVHPEDRERVTATVEAAIRSGGDFATLFRLAADAGDERVLASTGTVLLDAEGRAVWMSGTTRDVTDEHRGRLERQRLQEEFLQAQKLEALALLSGEIAHDFNNALTAIRGYAALVLDQLDPESAAARDALELARTAEHATVLPRQLLAFARRQTGRSRELDAYAMVLELRPLLQHVLGVERPLTLPEPTELWVRADPGQLEQALVNVTLNARDALEGRAGGVTIETELVELGEAEAGELGVPPGAYGSLRVSDTGVGMDEATAARSLEPFFTTKEDRGGTGLGLPAVVGGLSHSGGALRITSRPGVGTTVEILLPAAEAPVATGAPADVPAATGAAATVVVVDDEPQVLAVIARVLEEAGYTVVAVPSGAAALAALDGEARDAALLVTDLRMPDLGGVELAATARRAVPGLSVLFLSGFPEDLPPEDAGHLLAKPFSPEELVAAVARRLAAAGARVS